MWLLESLERKYHREKIWRHAIACLHCNVGRGNKNKKNPKKREEVRNEENFNYYLDFGINWAIWGKQSKTKN